MQTLKSHLVLGAAAALCMTALARGAESQTQPQAPETQPENVSQSQPAAQAGAANTPVSSADAIERAREAMRAKMEQLWLGTSAPLHDSEQIAKARAALRQKMAQLDMAQTGISPTPSTRNMERPSRDMRTPSSAGGTTTKVMRPNLREPTGPAPMTQKGTPTTANSNVQRPQSSNPAPSQAAPSAGPAALSQNQPFAPPPAAVSSDKEQRLMELLRKYRADEIGPEQYQTDRAKILSGK